MSLITQNFDHGVRRAVLDRDVDITEIALQWIACVDGVRTGSMKDEINRANGLVHAVRNREARLRNLACWVLLLRADGYPRTPHCVNDIGSSRIENGFRFSHASLYVRAISNTAVEPVDANGWRPT